MTEFADLKGKEISKIEQYLEELHFYTSKGYYRLYHSQDCCENVYLADVVGEFEDLINTPILMAYEAISDYKAIPDEYGTSTWTFYHLATIKGYVTLRWVGSSNGYYSERVDIEFVENGD